MKSLKLLIPIIQRTTSHVMRDISGNLTERQRHYIYSTVIKGEELTQMEGRGSEKRPIR